MGWALNEKIIFKYDDKRTPVHTDGNNAAWVCPCGHPVLFVYQHGRMGSSSSRPSNCPGCGAAYSLRPPYSPQPPAGVTRAPAEEMAIVKLPFLTTDRLLTFARKIEGSRLETLDRRRPFTLCVHPSGIEFVPASTGNPRLVSREIVEQVCDEYNRSRSLRPGHYQAITFDASYLLSLIDRYQREEG